jgi:hypothetical protein
VCYFFPPGSYWTRGARLGITGGGGSPYGLYSRGLTHIVGSDGKNVTTFNKLAGTYPDYPIIYFYNPDPGYDPALGSAGSVADFGVSNVTVYGFGYPLIKTLAVTQYTNNFILDKCIVKNAPGIMSTIGVGLYGPTSTVQNALIKDCLFKVLRL